MLLCKSLQVPPITFKTGKKGHGLTENEVKKIFLKEGFKPRRGVLWVTEWVNAGMINQGTDGNDMKLYMFPTNVIEMLPNMEFYATPTLPKIKRPDDPETEDITSWVKE